MVIIYRGQGNGDVEKIKVEGDEEREVIVRHGIVSPKWNMLNYKDFSRRRNKAYRIPKRENIVK